MTWKYFQLAAWRVALLGVPVFLLLQSQRVTAQTSPATLPDLKLSAGGEVLVIVGEPDGKVIIGGNFFAVNGVPRNNIARLNPNGSVDATWDPQADRAVRAVVIIGNDIFVGGEFAHIGGQSRNSLAKISASGNGQADAAWDPNASEAVYAMTAIGTDLYVGGAFTGIAGQPRNHLAKLNTTGTGTADPVWNPSANGAVWAMATINSNLFVGGLFTTVGGQLRTYLAKLSASGTGAADPTWNPSPDNYVLTMAALDTNLFVGAYFTTIGGQSRNYLAKLSSTGTGAADPAWSPNPDNYILSVSVSGSNVYAGGWFTHIGGQSRNYLARLSSTGAGATVSTWNPNPNYVVQSTAAFGGEFYAGGAFELVGGALSLGLAKINPVTGARDEAFPAQVQAEGVVRAIVRQADGKFIVGGHFWFSGDLPRQHLLRINTDGTLDTTWNPNPNDEVSTLVLSGTNLYVGGDFTSIAGTNRNYIARLNTSGELDAVWNPNASGAIRTLALDGTNIYAGGEFNSIGGQNRNYIARLGTAGSGAADAAWNPNANDKVRSLAVSGTNVYVGGYFTSIGTKFRNYLARLTTAGSGAADATWNPSANDYVRSVELNGTNLYVGGNFTFIGGQSRNFIARVSASGAGALDAGWNPNADAEVFRTLVVGTNVYVGGSFNNIGGQSRSRVARLDSAGAGGADATWDPTVVDPNLTSPYFVAAFFVNGPDVYVGGRYNFIAGMSRWALAFLPVADAPVLVQNTGSSLIVSRNPSDGPEVTHFRITNISGASLYQSDGVTPINAGDFITVAQGSAGLKFAPGGAVTTVSALNNTPAGAGTAATTLLMSGGLASVFKFGSANYSVNEGGGSISISVLKVGTTAASVSYATASESATGGVDYQNQSGTLSFAANETNKIISIGIVDDFLTEGDETFTISLSAPTAGNSLTYPSTVPVRIVDNDIVGAAGSYPTSALPSPLLPPASRGVLIVSLQPVAANGQWRLLGEPAWRDGGSTLNGLVTGNYAVEFKPVSSYLQPATLTFPVTSGVTNTLTAFYAATTNAEVGDLSVVIEPDDLATNANITLRGQWRRQGESNWRDSGEKILSLNAGIHIVEFKAVSERATPPSQSVMVGANQENTVSGIYLISASTGGVPPSVLNFSAVTSNVPYLYNGQIQTDLGFSSGVVVKQRVVLTAAHVLFDDTLLTYVTSARWFLQKHKGDYEPLPQSPRGWYVFEGYAAQRHDDLTSGGSPGLSTPASQNLDVAAMYFVETPLDPNFPGRGGYGGFLSSDALDNEWLVSSRSKLLVGYPLDNVNETNQGRMHATAPANLAFTHLYQRVYSTTDIRSFPGNSGGPLYVQFDDGKFYPAGLYLGGSAQTLVRAIDSTVVDLINRAEISGNGGGNNTGGGVLVVNPGQTAAPIGAGLLTVSLTPSNAVNIRPGWRIKGLTDTNYFTDALTTVAVIGGGAYPIEFRAIPGFLTPGNRTVTVAVGGLVRIQGDYVGIRPQLGLNRTNGLVLSGGIGANYRVEFKTNLTTQTTWTTLTSFRLSASSLLLSNTLPVTSGNRFYRAVLVP